MSTVRARSLAAVLPLLLLPLAACTDDPPPPYAGSGYDDVATLMQRTLDKRARGLRTHDIARFRRALDRSDAGLVEEQQVYFDNLAQLPVGELHYELATETITPVEGSEDYWVEVVLSLGLDGYDTAPSRTRDRFLFTPARDGRRLLITSTTDDTWEAAHPGNVQPWDVGPVRVERSVGVLGIFDDTTVRRAGTVLDAASSGRSDVRSTIGSTSGATPSGVVVYAVGDPAFLHGLTDQTVGDPDRADGLTIAVPVDRTDPRQGVASYRVFLNPRVLDQPSGVLGRLVRHELTHATLGSRGRGAPLWLSEGVAEYVSVQPMTPARRRLPARALDLAATVTDLPGSAEFGGPDAEGWYAVSWWVCEYVASVYGAPMLFVLLDRLADGADQAQVLPAVLGVGPAQLAQRGVGLMERTYSGQ
ncbi:hypothetical protein [Nocardioides daeguensis]|uniref:Peptidase MA-like domain-containing protein n=1 Tax=Nocardioides daeguensis TaxID=908359 RepID=A0ABP6UTP6_9ACTN|nr:hypothetical protein [Nocardioides daeguensis]MBV6725542.1 hypothetical protein [Nocardioides daeguensis]MCR1771402.1 hypothetical protein [Nocardioides daeguensis]